MTKSKGTKAPFPVKAILDVQAPPELGAYDVSEFKVCCAHGEHNLYIS